MPNCTTDQNIYNQPALFADQEGQGQAGGALAGAPKGKRGGHRQGPLGIERNFIPDSPDSPSRYIRTPREKATERAAFERGRAKDERRENWQKEIEASKLNYVERTLLNAPASDVRHAQAPVWGRFENVTQIEAAALAWRRARRFALQSAAVAALPHFKRLAKCCRVPRGSIVPLKHSPSTKGAYYQNLATCTSVWVCPVCSSKISERRREELGRGVATWRESGGSVWLVTLTFSHTRYDALKPMMDKLSKAMTKFQGGRRAKDDREAFEIAGQVRSLEVTYSTRNGWHPHFHMLFFTGLEDTDANRAAFQATLFARWFKACQQVGIGLPSEKHGVRVDGHSFAGEYVTKWGVESELTRHASKEARSVGGSTPFGLLADFLATGDLLPRLRFKQFADAFKGQHQLRWSRGLKDLLGIEDVTDEELAEADEEQVGDQLMANIPLEVWREVIRCEVRGRLLELACTGDVEAVGRFLRALPGIPEIYAEWDFTQTESAVEVLALERELSIAWAVGKMEAEMLLEKVQLEREAYYENVTS